MRSFYRVLPFDEESANPQTCAPWSRHWTSRRISSTTFSVALHSTAAGSMKRRQSCSARGLLLLPVQRRSMLILECLNSARRSCRSSFRASGVRSFKDSRRDARPIGTPLRLVAGPGDVSAGADRRQPVDRFHACTITSDTEGLHRAYILDPEACVAEPITFEILRYATPDEQRLFQEHVRTMPMLSTPATLWTNAVLLGSLPRTWCYGRIARPPDC